MIAAAILGEADRVDVWREKSKPALVKNARQEASMWLARSEDAGFFLGSLREAGLDLQD